MFCSRPMVNDAKWFPELPVQHTILEDDFVHCRVILIKWVASYAHYMKKPGSEGGQPSSMTSTSSHQPHSGTPTPAASLHHEEETSFTVGHPSDSSRASSHDSTSITPHPSLESGILYILNSSLLKVWLHSKFSTQCLTPSRHSILVLVIDSKHSVQVYYIVKSVGQWDNSILKKSQDNIFFILLESALCVNVIKLFTFSQFKHVALY